MLREGFQSAAKVCKKYVFQRQKHETKPSRVKSVTRFCSIAVPVKCVSDTVRMGEQTQYVGLVPETWV